MGLAAGAVACTSFGGRRWGEHPVTITEVVILSQHGVAPEKIIAKMRRGGTVYNLSEEQYAALRKKGVTPAVIAYMQQSYAEAVREFPKLAEDKDLSCWSLGFDGFWYLGRTLRSASGLLEARIDGRGAGAARTAGSRRRPSGGTRFRALRSRDRSGFGATSRATSTVVAAPSLTLAIRSTRGESGRRRCPAGRRA